MKKLIPLMLFALLALQVKAQDKFCGAAELINEELKRNALAKLNHEELEAFTKSWIEQSGEQKNSTHEYVIPLVVHVFHDYSPNTFVSKDHVLDAVRILNRDIKALNPDTANIDPAFKPVIGGLNVRFELAKIDPDGECTDGITRTYTPLTHQGDERLKSLISWDTEKYMNIWLCRSLSFSAGGYAFYPGTAPSPSQEGIVCINTQFGSVAPSSGTQSNLAARTITHEAGHYLNLQHTWGNSNTPDDPNNCTIDDFVDDTPVCAGSRSTCPLGKNSCNDTTYYGFDQVDNIQNYMDYAPCESMFTKGQAARMEAALNSSIGSRLYLWQDSTLIATGLHQSSPTIACAMKIDFRANRNMVCVGESVQLIDYSWNGTAQTRNWTISRPSYTISSPSDSMPTLVFTDTGYYDVELSITSITGGSSSLLLDSFIYVTPNSNGTPTFAENFEGSRPLNNLVQVGNPINFVDANGVGSQGSQKSTVVYANGLQESDIITLGLPALDLSNSTQPELSFDYAFAKSDTSSNDELKILVSTNCGKTWIPRGSINTNQLHTASQPTDANFVPTSSEWDSYTLSLSSVKVDPVLVQFQYTNPSSRLYLDNINIRESSVSLEEELLASAKVYPNPTTGHLNISFSDEFQNKVKIRLLDLQGRDLQTVSLEGQTSLQIDLSNYPPGIFLLEIETDGFKTFKKVQKL